MTDYLKMSGMYWGLTALDLMDAKNILPEDDIIKFIQNCQDKTSGGISATLNHDPHILYTLSACQVLSIYGKLNNSVVNIEGIVGYIKGLQQEDGSFFGDKWGEVDTRFSFCAVLALALLGRLDAINIEKAKDFVISCMNFDGGFGSRPLSESHAGLIYCCVGFLSVTNNLDVVDRDALSWWLAERQLPSGGLCGRPEKLPDVCYSWWVLSSLVMLGRLHWIDKDKLIGYILACQDNESGGFADRPGDMPDPFHTVFGLAALSLLGYEEKEVDCGDGDKVGKRIREVNATFCMPQYVIDRIGIKSQYLRD